MYGCVCACVVYVYMCLCVDYDQVVYESVNSEGGSLQKVGRHASSAPPMVVNAVHWGSPFTFYSKSDPFCSRIFIVISIFWQECGLRLVVYLTVTSSVAAILAFAQEVKALHL